VGFHPLGHHASLVVEDVSVAGAGIIARSPWRES
jgi:hypothetical protein